MTPRIAVYPGSFDPVTNGHLDIVLRAGRLFGRVIVAVSNAPHKTHTFTTRERLAMLRECVKGMPNVEVDTFSGLLVDYVLSKKATVLIRGLRVVSDMDYEFQMASMNRRLHPEIETVFLMPADRYTYLSSSIVKEVTRMGAHVEQFIPPPVQRRLRMKFAAGGKRP
jgi:pantetheine-phosphate adenylyltransferase